MDFTTLIQNPLNSNIQSFEKILYISSRNRKNDSN